MPEAPTHAVARLLRETGGVLEGLALVGAEHHQGGHGHPLRLLARIHRYTLDRLRREIVATCVGNQLVNLSGISFDHRVAEETGMPVTDTVRAWLAARDILHLDDWWREVDALTGVVKLDVQLDLFLELRSMVERATLWLMRHRPLPIGLAAVVGEFRDGMSAVAGLLHDHVPGRLRSEAFSLEASRLAAGVPERLAQHVAALVVEAGPFAAGAGAGRTDQ